MAIKLGKWIRGWRLDKLFQSHKDKDISLVKAAATASQFLEKLHKFLSSEEVQTLEALFPGAWQEMIQKANPIIEELKNELSQISGMESVAISLSKYKFFDDKEKDRKYHAVVTSAALIFSDGKISISDAAVALQLINELF